VTPTVEVPVEIPDADHGGHGGGNKDKDKGPKGPKAKN
jgi:hypothetical protein